MAPYLTADAIKDRVPFLNGVDDDVITELVAEFEDIAERYRGCAFTPREVTHTVDVGWGTREVVLPHPYVTAIDSLSVDGTAFTEDEIDDYIADHLDSDAGILGNWSRYGRVAITYTHGLAEPPPAVLRACREYVKAEAVLEGTDVPREVASYTDESGMTYRYTTPDWDAGRPTGIGKVDTLLNTVPDRRLPAIA